MEEKELNTLFRRKDGDGNIEVHYPITKAENILGLDVLLAEMKADTNGLDGFDFDNLAGKPGMAMETAKQEDGTVWETIEDMERGRPIVRRVTVLPVEKRDADKTIMVIERYEFFDSQGDVIARTVTVETIKDKDGKIREEVRI